MNVALLLEASGYAHYILGENGLAAYPNVKRLFDETAPARAPSVRRISGRNGCSRPSSTKKPVITC
jgi:GST-like protein